MSRMAKVKKRKSFVKKTSFIKEKNDDNGYSKMVTLELVQG